MNNIKEHYGAFILSIITGFIMLAPQLVFMHSLGAEYKGVYIMGSDAEPYYVARMQEFYDGNGIGNAYYFENKNDVPNIYFTVSESLLALPGDLLGISAAKLNLIYKFVLPGLVFLLVYFLLYRLLGRRMWSLAGASLVVMGNLLLSVPDVLHMLKFEMVYSEFSLFSRPVNPEFSSIVFFSYLHLLLYAIRSNKTKFYIILALLFGSSFYFYFYSWTFILSLNVCLAIVLFFYKDFRPMSWKIVVATVLGLILGARALVELVAVKVHPFTVDLAGIYDVVSHRPIISMAGVFITALFTFYFWKQKPRKIEDYFLLGLLVATFASVNQQVITGILMQSGHYHWYFNTPIFIAVLVYLGAEKIPNNFAKIIPILLIFLSIISASFVQHSSYVYHKEEVVEQQDFAQIFDWLNNNTTRDSVVLASDSMSFLVPAYTVNNVFEHYYGSLSLISPERRAYTTEVLLEDLNNGRKPQFHLDYIVWDTLADPDWKIDAMKIAKEETTFGRLRIYRVSPLKK